MPFYLRKSVSVGPFRFNLSKSGIGISAGLTGLRLGKGPRGTYVHAGRGGVYYRKTLSNEPGGVLFHPKDSPALQDAPESATRDVIDSGSVLRMVDAKSADVLQELNYRPRSYEAWLTVICTVAIVSGLFFVTLPWWLSGAVLAAGLVVIVFMQQRSSVNKTVAMLYDLEPEVEQSYARLHEVFDELRRAKGIWHVEARVESVNSNDHVTQEVHRKHIEITNGLPPFLRCNLEAPKVPVGKQTLFFLPDMLLAYEDGHFGAIGYRELNIEIVESRLSDANTEEIHFSSSTGLNELLQVSPQGLGEKLKSAVADLSRFSNETKARLS